MIRASCPHPDMWLTAILFNPTAQVYNFRLVVLADVAFVILRGVRKLPLAGVIMAHHILAVFPLWGATGDWCLIGVEIALSAYMADGPLVVLQLTPLVVAMIFRTATIMTTTDRFWQQRLYFLGGCPGTRPEYTPWRILLNRSLGRPLVRGEFIGIIICRALILSGVILGLPMFTFYAIVFLPNQAKVYTRNTASSIYESFNLERDAAITLWDPFDSVVNMIVEARENLKDTTFLCPSNVNASWTVAACPGTKWSDLNVLTITISFVQPTGVQYVSQIVELRPGQGDMDDINQFTDPIAVLPGSQLTAYMQWTKREMLSRGKSSLFPTSPTVRSVGIMEVTSLLHLPQTLDPAASFSATLTILQRSYYGFRSQQQLDAAFKTIEEYKDVSMLDGVSTVGGLWTFLNGAFVFLFGANIIPLSALGVAHVLQRKRLAEKWHEDFPAIHTEGGSPDLKVLESLRLSGSGLWTFKCQKAVHLAWI
ncbi:hypothetical protein B0H13DRAFT_2343086 [Mycena leptocephala]|nr:hypothetical protein B0H13DRAFT_2343086 [Mycena leptocephala]